VIEWRCVTHYLVKFRSTVNIFHVISAVFVHISFLLFAKKAIPCGTAF
jgi:hypothetical protein